jgi:hypothetical protein
MVEVQTNDLSAEQQYQARRLNEGEIILAHQTDDGVRMHTKHGEKPYVWRHIRWIPTE